MTVFVENSARRRFCPEHHGRELLGIIREIEALPAEAVPHAKTLDSILRKYPREGKGFFSRSQIIAGFRFFARSECFDLDGEAFARRLRLKPVRSQSGVSPVTVLTKPYPCPGRCVFCPSDVRMPKSYLRDEPGAQRAAHNAFDPYRQIWSRLETLRAIGHSTDKIELIVLGGTWSFYPEPYQLWFTTRCIEALNDFGKGEGHQPEKADRSPDFRRLSAPASEGSYNQRVRRFLSQELDGRLVPEWERGSWGGLHDAQLENERAVSRCVGLTFETRPDCVTPREALRLRRLGCTKVQLGIQSLSDRVLALNQRGHTVAVSRRAVAILRRVGFKIHAHWMPNLLGSTPEQDVRDFARLFDDPGFRPDELKIYPCSLIESAELMNHHRDGSWRPYTHAELLSVLTEVLAHVPRYCRTTRVIRDISSNDIVAGNKRTNFRELAEQALREQGRACRDIRSREIGTRPFDAGCLSQRTTSYASEVGRECFLEYVTADDRIVGFVRLLFPTTPAPSEEIEGSALLRELHVYGTALSLGRRADGQVQHAGLGRRLVEDALERAAQAGSSRLSVISAIGTRAYYRRLGFEDGSLYQHHRLG